MLNCGSGTSFSNKNASRFSIELPVGHQQWCYCRGYVSTGVTIQEASSGVTIGGFSSGVTAVGVISGSGVTGSSWALTIEGPLLYLLVLNDKLKSHTVNNTQ